MPEKLVIQHADMNVLCPTSVNTMRVMTCSDNGTPVLLWMGLRVGNGVNPVDNFHAQGMGVKIDMDACLESDKILMVGWDVAFSDKGPVIIEGNRWPGFDLVQVLDDRGRMDIVRDVLARYKKGNLHR